MYSHGKGTGVSLLGNKDFPSYRTRSDDVKLPSHAATTGNTYKKETPAYTGDLIVGISTMHKSNSVPIVRGSDMAEATAKMRRG